MLPGGTQTTTKTTTTVTTTAATTMMPAARTSTKTLTLAMLEQEKTWVKLFDRNLVSARLELICSSSELKLELVGSKCLIFGV